MLEIYNEIVKMISKGEGGVLATVISTSGSAPRKEGAKMLIKKDGTYFGTVGGGGVEKQVIEKAKAVLESGVSQIFHFDMTGTGREAAMICGGQVDILMEPIDLPEALYLFGAGHISQSTALLGKRLGFRIVVIDPRPDYNNRDRFPTADVLVVKDFTEAFKELNVTRNDYIIIYTTGHLFDEECLTFAVTTDAKYIGMIGSRKKSAEVKKRVQEKGTSKEKIDLVHSPIGLEIGAETPEEIAVSILAEVIKVKRGQE